MRRNRIWIGIFFITIIVLIVLFFLVTGCSGEPRYTVEQWEKIDAQKREEAQKDILYRAKILDILSDETKKLEGNYEGRTQLLKVKITSGIYKNEVLEVEHYTEPGSAYNIIVRKGDNVLLGTEKDQDGNIINAYVVEIIRDKYVLYLVIAFSIILILVGGLKGLKALVALILTGFAVMKVLLPLILKGYNPILISVGVCLVIIIITLLIISGFSKKTLATFIGTSGGILIAGAVALIFGFFMKLTGLGSEEAKVLMYIPQEVNFDFRGLLFSGIILASLGAVMDVGMSISSSMYEIVKANPEIKKKDLLVSGINVGRDIIGTMSNTLILVYIGGALPLVLLLLAYNVSFAEIINRDFIASEILRALAGSIGLILAIPITVFVAGTLFKRESSWVARRRL